MDLFEMATNIYQTNYEEELRNSIKKVLVTLEKLTEERTCKIYSSYLYEELKRRHVPARLLTTLDLGLMYEHQFVLVPSNQGGYFLADLTFRQFGTKTESLLPLLRDGYVRLTDDDFQKYLSIVGSLANPSFISIEDAFYGVTQEKSLSEETKSIR